MDDLPKQRKLTKEMLRHRLLSYGGYEAYRADRLKRGLPCATRERYEQYIKPNHSHVENDISRERICQKY